VGVDHCLTHFSLIAGVLSVCIALCVSVFIHTSVAFLSLLIYWRRIRAEAPELAQGENDHVDSFHRTVVTGFGIDFQARQ
jgi:hypothetical protein